MWNILRLLSLSNNVYIMYYGKPEWVKFNNFNIINYYHFNYFIVSSEI